MDETRLSPQLVRNIELSINELIAEARHFDEESYRRARVLAQNDRHSTVSADEAWAPAVVTKLGLSNRAASAMSAVVAALPQPTGTLYYDTLAARGLARRAILGLILAELQSPDIPGVLIGRLYEPWTIALTGHARSE